MNETHFFPLLISYLKLEESKQSLFTWKSSKSLAFLLALFELDLYFPNEGNRTGLNTLFKVRRYHH